jgi:class 3 adenylate cyclase/tetratricopeptide (TPR) repeat protein
VAGNRRGETGTRTIVFTDLVDSTALRAALGDVAADKVRSEYDRLLRDAIAQHGGVVAKGLGDGVMAVFEAAADAAECAVVMQQEIDRLRRRRGAKLSIRVGLSAGDVGLERGDWFGMPVVEAARLEAAADGDEILASDLVRLLAGSRAEVTFEPVGELSLKGLEAPLAACAIRWDSPSEVSVVPLPPALRASGFGFVGREPQQKMLASSWDETAGGALRIVLVAGEAGIGKTRLAAEFAARVHAKGAIVLAGRCDEDLAVPYQPFVEALRYFVNHTGDDLANRLGRYPGELSRLVPGLSGRVPDLPQPLKADPETERYRLFEAMASWLEAASEDDPLLLVLDDLHWATKPTILLLRHLLRADAPARLLVLGTYRQTDLARDAPLREFLADLHRGIDAERIALEGLEDAEVAALLADALGRPLSSAEVGVARRIRSETAGNAFFASELVRHVGEVGAPEDTVVVPDSVREVVGRRLARLSDDTNSVLVAAAVTGTEFDVSLVGAVTQRSEADVLDALESATRMRLLEEAALDRYRFAHILVRETIYDGLTQSRRVRLHRLVADAIESLHADDLDEHVVTMAHHLAEIARHDPKALITAVDYAADAGAHALARLAPDDALYWYRYALERLEATGEPNDARRGALLVGLGIAQRDAGNPESRRTLLDAAYLAQLLGDTDLLVRAAVGNSARGMASTIGEVDADRVAVLEAALDATAGIATPERATLLAFLAAEVTWVDRDRARTLSDAALGLAREIEDDLTLWNVLGARFTTICSPATLDERSANAYEQWQAAERLGSPYHAEGASGRMLMAAAERGDLVEVDEYLDRAARFTAETDLPWSRFATALYSAWRRLLAGRIDESEEAAAEALQVATDWDPNAFTFYAAQIYDIRRAQGRLGEIIQLLEQAVAANPRLPSFRVMLAAALCEIDRAHDAREVFEPLVEHGFEQLAFDVTWLTAMMHCAEVAAHLDHRRAAEMLNELLAPWRDRFVSTGITCAGSVARPLGLVLGAAGRLDEADEALAEAAAVHERIDAPIELARTRVDWARVLVIRNRPSDRGRARELLGLALSTAETLGLTTIKRRARSLLGELTSA